MPEVHERAPQERDNLVFETPEQAQEFSERVGERINQQDPEGSQSPREVVAQELEVEFERFGESAQVLHQPWEHTAQEHEEAQRLVDTAFTEDLPAALKKAQESDFYPRNIDLLHDVLTGQLYDVLLERGLNRQRLGSRMTWFGAAGVLVLVILALAILLFV